MNINLSFNECLNKTIIIKLLEDDEINTEFFVVNNLDEYNFLKNYIITLSNNNILDDYYVYEE